MMTTIAFQKSSKDLKNSILSIDEDAFFLLLDPTLKPENIQWHQGAQERLQQVGRMTQAGMVYADYLEADGQKHPLIDYQVGSLRDDFDFGKVLWIDKAAALRALEEVDDRLAFGAFYALRLAISRAFRIIHLRETLYRLSATENIDKEARQFAYVDPKQRAYQIEMEQICTGHLKAIGAYLPERQKSIDLQSGSKEGSQTGSQSGDFPVEASVIIPVRNRIKTIREAVLSALQQVCDFPFNVIVVDNHSTDGTRQVLENLALEHSHLKPLFPEREDLNIGGCWNYAINSEHCGRFAVQLDSDDLYSDENTLQKIVNLFYQEQCAMVVGSYRICNFQKQTLPPGLIDHREWTPENGHNNALRINGLGAPRAFYTPLLRSLQLPNTSYGEDYAIGLAISRNYRIGRIYEELYLCRRWEDNSDADISLDKLNANNAYKDLLRSMEVMARQAMNQNESV